MNKKNSVAALSCHRLPCNRFSRITKLIFSLLIFSVFILKAGDVYSQSTKVTLSLNNASLEEVLNEIEKQTDYLFIINSNVDTSQKTSIRVTDQDISQVLPELLKGKDINYSIEGTHIVLSGNVLDKKTAEQKEVIVSGNVSDLTGEPLLGVNVMYKGSLIGVITDLDGNYSIKIPGSTGELVFTYIGYNSTTVPVNGQTKIDVVLSESSEILTEVVVTAMGIERKAKSLTYATQQVGGKELTRAKDANFINSLQGKTSGLVITPNSTGAGGSSKLLLRGNASVLGNNQPLIVLDGVPMASRDGDQIGDALLNGGNGTDGGDGLSNINPDDIANITVLKGANAAALYGAAAGNGVIIITTKQGTEGRVSIEVSSSSLFETPLVTPKFQNNYGGSVENYEDKSLNPNIGVKTRRLSLFSFGPRIGSLSDATLAEIPYARNSAMDNVGSFLRMGTNFNNSVSVTGGTKVAQTYFSYGYTDARGLIPNNEFSRHNATFRQTVNLFKDRLKLNFSGSYIVQKSKNRPGSGFYANSLYPLYTMPRNADIAYFKDNSEAYGDLYYLKEYVVGGGYKNMGTQGPIQQWPWIEAEDANSPYWYMNRLDKLQRRERLFATIGANLKITKELSAQARFKVDRTNDSNETKTWKGAKAKELYNSLYEYAKFSSNQIYADFLVSYSDEFGDFDVSANVGGSTQKDDYDMFGIVYWMRDSTAVQNVFDPANVVGMAYAKDGPRINKTVDQNWENALYATAQVGYKEMAYIDATVRKDWARAFSQFDGTKKSYNYYSVGGNVFLDQVFGFTNNQLSDMKLRVSYSEVGTPIPNLNLEAMKKDFATGSAKAREWRPFVNPGPERVHSTEIGLDARLFNKTVDADITFYNSLMEGQWLPQPAATGGKIPLNSGKIRNRGLETSISYTLSPNHDFNWKTTVNYSFNANKVLETYGENKNTPIIMSLVFQGGLQARYEVGRPYGELYGKTFLYEDDGVTIKTDRMGAPRLTSDYNCYLGNANSPHHLSWNNNINYKDFSLFFLIDGKIGGKVISYTEARLDYFGVSKKSGDARDEGVVYMQKSTVGGDIVYKPVQGVVMPDGNIAPAEGYFQTIGGGEPALSQYVYDATNFRLREVSVGYTFNSLFGNGRHLNVSLVGRNLFFIYKKAPVDPDVSVSTSNSYSGIEAFSLPTTRSFGINLKATF